MRRTMFLSQDGVMLCTTVRALEEIGVLEPSLASERSVADLLPGVSEPGFGALRAAMRCLASVGWLSTDSTLDPETTVVRWADAGRLVMRTRDRYVALGRFLAGFSSTAPDAWTEPWTGSRADAFRGLVDTATERWRLDPDLPESLAAQVATQLDAGLVVPTLTWLYEADRLGEAGPELPADGAGEAMRTLLEAVRFVDGDTWEWSAAGRRARDFALGFAIVATYLPLLARLPELYRGELTVGSESGAEGHEWHVHRGLNLKVSTNAHRRYFADADAIFTDLFDRARDARPQFIADMGCGDGTWLVHLHELLRRRFGEVPLMVGIDCNPTVLERARRRLAAAGVPVMLLLGDVSDPDQVSADLAPRGLRMEDGLHIRAFLDHDRAYRGGDPAIPAPGWSSGAYIDGNGCPLEPAAVERDLVAHLRRWTRHVGRHGMVILEAHCVAPRVANRHLGALHSVAFDAYHEYSQQYPIDHAAYVRCCREAGLQPEGRFERHYPANLPFVAVSVNRFVGTAAGASLPGMDRAAAREDTWEPDSDDGLGDGRALHELLFADGDLRFPKPWACAPTGFVVAGALEAIETRLRDAVEGDVIRVLDYGAGTGTATIELLKACRERHLDARLEDRGVTLELHLVDLPSSWFAQGFATLHGCAWTRFHSLRSAGGGFRPLVEVTGGRTIDAVMANMVFHLIPAKALGRAASELAAVLRARGRLVWSSPDLGPAGPYTALLHDPNRALRKRWLELLQGANGVSPSPAVRGAVETARRALDPEDLRAAQERAERRILPRPLASDVTAALDAGFDGEVETRAYEMLGEEIVDGLLVPSNQAEYLPEIGDPDVREAVIRELMTDEVIPAMQEGPAGTALGLNLHWTLGSCTKRR